jgi:hypothetical protein
MTTLKKRRGFSSQLDAEPVLTKFGQDIRL